MYRLAMRRPWLAFATSSRSVAARRAGARSRIVLSSGGPGAPISRRPPHPEMRSVRATISPRRDSTPGARVESSNRVPEQLRMLTDAVAAARPGSGQLDEERSNPLVTPIEGSVCSSAAAACSQAAEALRRARSALERLAPSQMCARHTLRDHAHGARMASASLLPSTASHALEQSAAAAREACAAVKRAWSADEHGATPPSGLRVEIAAPVLRHLENLCETPNLKSGKPANNDVQVEDFWPLLNRTVGRHCSAPKTSAPPAWRRLPNPRARRPT